MDILTNARATVPAGAGRRHRTKMNKAEFPELIALTPVYPGVDRLRGDSGKRV
jgi:hypothetical protein